MSLFLQVQSNHQSPLGTNIFVLKSESCPEPTGLTLFIIFSFPFLCLCAFNTNKKNMVSFLQWWQDAVFQLSARSCSRWLWNGLIHWPNWWSGELFPTNQTRAHAAGKSANGDTWSQPGKSSTLLNQILFWKCLYFLNSFFFTFI